MCRVQHLGCFYTLNFVCDITLTLQEVYLPVSETYSGSINRFNLLLLVTVVRFESLPGDISEPPLLWYVGEEVTTPPQLWRFQGKTFGESYFS
jgi:hypothetical protein